MRILHNINSCLLLLISSSSSSSSLVLLLLYYYYQYYYYYYHYHYHFILFYLFFYSNYIPLPAKMRCRDSIAQRANDEPSKIQKIVLRARTCLEALTGQQSNVVFWCNTYNASNYPRMT